MIVLDPGHGGIDPGAMCGGVKEASLALIYALTLAGELARLGIPCTLTRERDEMPGGGTLEDGLTFRAQVANRLQARAFVSLHMNASSAPSARGLWLLHAAGAPGGRALAETLEAELGGMVLPDASIHTHDRRLAVLRRTKMPACLIELGYLTNAEERAELLHVAHLRSFVERCARALNYWLAGGHA